MNLSKELLALWSLAVLVIITSAGIAIFAAKSESSSIVIGGLMAAVPMLINSIRNLGQSRAMQTMVDALGNSVPANQTLDLTGAEILTPETERKS